MSCSLLKFNKPIARTHNGLNYSSIAATRLSSMACTSSYGTKPKKHWRTIQKSYGNTFLITVSFWAAFLVKWITIGSLITALNLKIAVWSWLPMKSCWIPLWCYFFQKLAFTRLIAWWNAWIWSGATFR